MDEIVAIYLFYAFFDDNTSSQAQLNTKRQYDIYDILKEMLQKFRS